MFTKIDGTSILFEGDEVSPGVSRRADMYPGQDHSLSPYCTSRHCEAFIFVYDICDRSSFEALKWHYKNILLERSLARRSYCILQCLPDCTARSPYGGSIFVIANKVDRDESEWEVDVQEQEDFCASIGADFIPMSAKTGKGCSRNTLVSMTNRILQRRIGKVAEGNRHDQVDHFRIALDSRTENNRHFWC